MLVGREQLDIPLWAAAALSLGYFRGTMQPLSTACYSVKTWAQTGLLVSGMARGFIHHNTTHCSLTGRGFREKASKQAGFPALPLNGPAEPPHNTLRAKPDVEPIPQQRPVCKQSLLGFWFLYNSVYSKS